MVDRPLVDHALDRIGPWCADLAVNLHHRAADLDDHLPLDVHRSLEEPVALGTAAVTSGVVVAALRGQNTISHFPAWAVLLPLAAAFGRSLTHTVTKIGYAEVPSPFFASLVGITVGFLLLAIHYKWKRYPLNLRGPGIKYFIGAGVVNTFALYLLKTALAVGKLITVAPVLALSPIFAMLMGLLIFRREQFTWRTFVTIALVVPGVILITLRG